MNTKRITDQEIETALLITNGKPVKAAELLAVDYVTVYRRLRENPALLNIQRSARAKAFNDFVDMLDFVAKTGFIQTPIFENNKPTGFYELIRVDERTRIFVLHKLANMFKADAGLTTETNVNITQPEPKGSIPVEKWLTRTEAEMQ